jgi:hypothetical protein
MKKLEECYKTHYSITFKVLGKIYICYGKHYYPTKKQYNQKDFEQVIVDDIAVTIIAKYKQENKIKERSALVSVDLKFED